MRFLNEFEQLQETEIPEGGDTNIEKLRYLFTSKGFQLDDPRIKDIIIIIEALEQRGEDINFDMFKELIRPCYTFFRQMVQNQLVIPDYEKYHRKCGDLYEKVKAKEFGGFIPTYIPELAKADENGFAVSICTVSGQVLNFGDVGSCVSMQHITSVVSYLNALEQHGHKVVSSYIGTEPSGK
jgi:glutaminase